MCLIYTFRRIPGKDKNMCPTPAPPAPRLAVPTGSVPPSPPPPTRTTRSRPRTLSRQSVWLFLQSIWRHRILCVGRGSIPDSDKKDQRRRYDCRRRNEHSEDSVWPSDVSEWPLSAGPVAGQAWRQQGRPCFLQDASIPPSGRPD